MRIDFIEAERDITGQPTSNWFDRPTGKFLCPSLAPITLAALIPDDIVVRFIDEKTQNIDLDTPPDCVAISYKTMSSGRAYNLADHYRSKDVKVVLGGIHASLLPDEAKAHADTVVVGEAEEIWPQLIADLRSNSLKPFYRQNRLTSLDKLKTPRFDLLKNSGYVCHSIQASRGCCLDCEFCPTREMFGGVFRTKPIANIVSEIEAAIAIEKKYIFFTDDIFGAGDKQFVLELLRRIKRMKIEFVIISDFLVLDKDILVALARSGCRYMALNLPGTCTPQELKAIRMIQALGIDVAGYFMFGFRIHKKDVFKRVYDFVKKARMFQVSFTVMAPYPNTNAGRRLEAESRILSKDWSLYDQAHVVSVPEQMSAEDLQKGYDWIRQELGHLSDFNMYKRRPLWKRYMSRSLCEISAILPNKSRKS